MGRRNSILGEDTKKVCQTCKYGNDSDKGDKNS